MTRNKPLTKKYIESIFTVNLITGKLYWKVSPKYSSVEIGKEAGHVLKDKRNDRHYFYITIRRVRYRRAHLILLLKTGVWPKNQADHINRNTLDDRAINLRHATVAQNSWNKMPAKRKNDLPHGVYLDGNKFRARIKKNYKSIHLGLFASKEKARAAYLNAQKKLFGEFAMIAGRKV